MELLLKRSQTSLKQIQNALSKYFEIRWITRGRHEWIEGDLKTEEGLGKQDPSEDGWVSITVPHDERARRTLTTRIFSPFSGTLYELSLRNLDLPMTLTVIGGLQDLGDVGFVSSGATGSGGRGGSSAARVRVFIWPEGRDAQLSKATELHQGYAELRESLMARRKPKPETPPYQLCKGMPSGELCPRCKYDIVKSGAEYCSKYHKPISA